MTMVSRGAQEEDDKNYKEDIGSRFNNSRCHRPAARVVCDCETLTRQRVEFKNLSPESELRMGVVSTVQGPCHLAMARGPRSAVSHIY